MTGCCGDDSRRSDTVSSFLSSIHPYVSKISSFGVVLVKNMNSVTCLDFDEFDDLWLICGSIDDYAIRLSF